jgi:hypothetical protein
MVTGQARAGRASAEQGDAEIALLRMLRWRVHRALPPCLDVGSGFNVLGDALRDVLDPQLRGRRGGRPGR